MAKLFFAALLLFVCLQGVFSEYLRQDVYLGENCDNAQPSEVNFYLIGVCIPYLGSYATVSYTETSATITSFLDSDCLEAGSSSEFVFGGCSSSSISSVVSDVNFSPSQDAFATLSYNGSCSELATLFVALYRNPDACNVDTDAGEAYSYTCTEQSSIRRTYTGEQCSSDGGAPTEIEEAFERCSEGVFVTFPFCITTGSVPTSAPEPVEPTGEPTGEPTVDPTAEPTGEPTVDPTAEPTGEPTVDPTAEPTGEPTVDPTAEPTGEPTAEPTAEPTGEPTVDPTAEPTEEPTGEPTVDPTAEPTEEPTEEPTGEPTEEPTGEPTEEPTGEPTEGPTGEPTEEPTGEPTEEPTGEPTEEPTGEPTVAPTGEPTINPNSTNPTITPNSTATPTPTPTPTPTRGADSSSEDVATGAASSVSFSGVLCAFVGLLVLLH